MSTSGAGLRNIFRELQRDGVSEAILAALCMACGADGREAGTSASVCTGWLKGRSPDVWQRRARTAERSFLGPRSNRPVRESDSEDAADTAFILD